MKRVESPDGLYGKRGLGPLGDVSRHLEHAPRRCGPCKCVEDTRPSDLVEQLLRDRPPYDPTSFDEGQARADGLGCIAEQTLDLLAAGFLEQPPQHGAALR